TPPAPPPTPSTHHPSTPSLLPPLTPLLIAGALMGLRLLGFLQPWELRAYDHLMRSRPAETADPRLLVVEVTQADSDRYGYPLSDDTLATLLETLQALQPRVIGVDLHRAQARGMGRERLLAQFQQHPHLVIVCGFGAGDRTYGPPPEFSPEQAVQQVGFSDLLLDGQPRPADSARTDLVHPQQASPIGDVVRRQLLSYDPTLAPVPSHCATPYSLGLQLAFRFLAMDGVQPLQVNEQGHWQLGTVALPALPRRFGGYQNLNGLSNQILINYRTAPPGQRVTLDQVLSGQITAAAVQDQVVLIGTTAPIARDSLVTPYGEMPGVWIHAHMVSQILSAVLDDRPLIWTLPQKGGVQWGDALWILVWAAVGAGLPRLRRRWVWLAAQGGATLALYYLCWVALLQGGWLPLVPSVLALWLTSGLLVGVRELKHSTVQRVALRAKV
ncbi:MAG: CHASE2 domain-containing protein, partial [Synechococcales bacterium]|nr:CHASE2 domain-containing protein [Synechococcales bacterium]